MGKSDKFLANIDPAWPLRLGLGLMYLYSAYDIFYNTALWKTYIPSWLFHLLFGAGIPIELFLKIQAVGEFVLGILFIAWFVPKKGVQIAAILSTLEMAFILLFVGIDRITFRDIGLLGAALGLFILTLKKFEMPETINRPAA